MEETDQSSGISGVSMEQMKEPFFSIIVPIYNAGKYLEKCVNSLLEQEHMEDNLEILLVDDGSTDQSGSLCDKMAAQFAQVKTFHKKNGGPSSARNMGMQHAGGQYIMFIDADDHLEKNACSRLYDAIRKYKNLDMVCFDGIEHTDKGLAFMKRIPLSEEVCTENGKTYLVNHYKNRNMNVEVCLYVYRKQFLQEHDLLFVEGRLHEDVEFTPRALLCCGRILELPDRLYHYMIHENSISTQKNKKKNIHDLFITLSEQCEAAELQEPELRKWMKNAALNRYLNMIQYARMYRPQYRKLLKKRFLFGKAATNWNRFRVLVCFVNVRWYCWMNDCYKRMKGL